ncbi:23S rRNA (adenine(2030)-N(6))-methyltransferase RlmJ [Castellaniella defragrans]|uniref:Ribosomal RNA large subunit methyltransferase J n=2 Tax=Castellaniella defragrans TaxID=75697 RepID=A0A7W9WLV4_CASDE|nr:23S rRNA (adenine(2030)-N(6))-methyltransferase RlmJ [Castellaniella defragrans]MBB6083647.1 23S rRNA (adenine2030-N6)-methyltransferase [Castellaniella defragrans]
MFSYRHAFHAGNHADVLKHAILVQILDYFNRKDAPYWVIDTHAGAGLYALDGEWAGQSGEVVDGLDRLLGAPRPPELVARYLRAVQDFNPDGVASRYPGSPALALHALRPHDKLRLFELHPTEIEVLESTLRQLDTSRRQVSIAREDGFGGLKRLLPPPTRRGIVLIDPSYEDKQDYRHTLQAVRDGLERFASGCFAVWYPLVQRVQAHEMARVLERLPVEWLHATLTVRKPSADGLGLHGSGMFVINPPWTLHEELRAALPWLEKTLAQDEHARHTLQNHAAAGASPAGKPARPPRPAEGRAPRAAARPAPAQKRSPGRK